MPARAPDALRTAAAELAGGQHHPGGALYMVATPIGNLADLTPRAVQLLALADAVACEDTRVSGRLLGYLGLKKPLLALHAHNERAAAQAVLERLAAGERVAYLSDAGAPGVCDPGALVAQAARAAGHPVLAVAGASSLTAALSVAGDAGDDPAHVFWGFVPAKTGERERLLAAMAAEPRRSVAFEAPHRIAATLAALAQAAPTRQLSIARELTKQFEQTVTLAAEDAPAWLASSADHARGEFVLVLHQQAQAPSDAALPSAALALLQALLPHLPLKQAVQLAADHSSAPRNALYAQALAWRDAAAPE